MKNYIRNLINSIRGRPINYRDDTLMKELESIKLLAARQLLLKQKEVPPKDLHDAEFKVFSQFGEDGIIQHLIQQAAITVEEEIFVEFGVENYQESNTRFLLLNNNWKGLVIDQSDSNIEAISKSDLSWRHDLKALSLRITRDNIDSAISQAGISGKIGLLSVDIDGNDYWVWERIKCIEPVIVVIEYNSLFGEDKALVVPYNADFDRSKAHYSWLYWGASIAAITRLAASKGYALVGSNSAGCNLFFVKRERMGALREISIKQGFVRSKIRDSRSQTGELSFLGPKEQEAAVSECIVLDLDQGCEVKLGEIFNSSLKK